ncbi:radical SAM protein [Streptomyces sp. NPDC005281]|uniref:radical SAM protein n=1 Tax=Streptomyces sp. NPDC005281 TaxID=3155712 RepID=UPI0033A34EF6
MTHVITHASGVSSRRDAAFDREMVASLRSDSLHLIILPTEQCNFRCTYCYEDFEIGRMGRSTVEAIKRLIDRRMGDLRALSISWFGGEPLLARNVVEDISTHISEAVSGRELVSYVADMTTNGYLLDASAFEMLSGLGIRSYQVSLDGPSGVHDKTRRRADGKGSFDRIWQNLVAIRDSRTEANVLLRVHLTPANIHDAPELLVAIRDTFLADERFSVLLRPIERLGGPNDANMEILEGQQRNSVIAELESILHEGIDRTPLFDAPKVCYASRPNSLMVRADGRVGKCTVALSDPANTIGRLMPDGSVKIDQELLKPWLRGWSSGDWEDIGCPYGGMPRRSSPPLLQIDRKPTD